ncbi:uncharacterized protein DUF2868 [Orbus hercynius]|uniref:Uncharacterized protein DUF2868 n=1 Tax=Orbus hercynius TaxID=593135 RepID=A0A495RJA1_9GAMM|nr:DUF2868 domain-containing protein [Orbus hercynius]RKS87236.1 uncharacterized protein DUF2868 [Orbus hercynius]
MNQYLKSLWLTETVRLIEHNNGRFRDDEANRQARALNAPLDERIIMRAEIISEQHELTRAQAHWLNSVKLSMIILLIVAVFTGSGLALGALAYNPVNLYWALLCLLGVHLVTLCLWILSSVFLPNESGSLFIHLWLWLAKKLSQKTTTTQILPAFITLFSRQIRWLVGLIVNVLWTVILCAALIVLVGLLSTKNYSFEWQTTLLSAESVITLTRLLGELPAALGFSLPDTEMIRASEQAITNGEIRSAWAVWLLGIFIVYGVAVRAILCIFCWVKWRISCNSISLNLQYPEYQMLSHDLEPTSIKSVIDAQADWQVSRSKAAALFRSGGKNMLVAIDIETHWQSPENIDFIGFVNNHKQRETVLDLLQQQPAEKLLIAIDSDRTPDRGMIHLIQTLASKSSQTKVWFINQGRQWNNWQENLASLNIEQANSRWLLEGKHDA